MVLCSWAHISIPLNGRVAGVLCSSTLPLSDKTMTQYDEKQRQLSVIVPIEKMTQLSIAMRCVCVSVSVRVKRTPLGANGFKQHKRLINTSIFSLGGLTTHTFILSLSLSLSLSHTHTHTHTHTCAKTLKHNNTYTFIHRDTHKQTSFRLCCVWPLANQFLATW